MYARRTSSCCISSARRAVEHDAAVLEHVAAMRDLERGVGILFRKQHHRTGAIDGRNRLEDLRHHLGREADRRLIEQEDLRLGHQGPADRHHLLLAAAQGARRIVHPARQRREQRQYSCEAAFNLSPCRGSDTRPTAGSLRPTAPGTAFVPRGSATSRRPRWRAGSAPTDRGRQTRCAIRGLPGVSPLSARKIVVFPAPLAPSSTTSSPARTSNAIWRTAWKLPYDTVSHGRSARWFTTTVQHEGSRRSSVAQVRVEDGGVAADFVRRAFGDLLAVVEDHDPLAQLHHDLHLVLDQQDRDAAGGDRFDRARSGRASVRR